MKASCIRDSASVYLGRYLGAVDLDQSRPLKSATAKRQKAQDPGVQVSNQASGYYMSCPAVKRQVWRLLCNVTDTWGQLWSCPDGHDAEPDMSDAN